MVRQPHAVEQEQDDDRDVGDDLARPLDAAGPGRPARERGWRRAPRRTGRPRSAASAAEPRGDVERAGGQGRAPGLGTKAPVQGGRGPRLLEALAARWSSAGCGPAQAQRRSSPRRSGSSGSGPWSDDRIPPFGTTLRHEPRLPEGVGVEDARAASALGRGRSASHRRRAVGQRARRQHDAALVEPAQERAPWSGARRRARRRDRRSRRSPCRRHG